MTSLRPMRDRVIVQRDEEELLTPGGFIARPSTTSEKPARGTVVDVGDGRILDTGLHVAVTLEEGDRVMFAKYAGVEVEIDNVEYVILREDEVIGVFKKPESKTEVPA